MRWRSEQEQLRLQKRAKYRGCLRFILERLSALGEFELAECQEEAKRLIPNVEIFKEIMVELIRSREIDIPALKKERSNFIQEASGGFQLNEMLLQLLEAQEEAGGRSIQRIFVSRIEDAAAVTFEGVRDETGQERTIRCSNLLFRAK